MKPPGHWTIGTGEPGEADHQMPQKQTRAHHTHSRREPQRRQPGSGLHQRLTRDGSCRDSGTKRLNPPGFSPVPPWHPPRAGPHGEPGPNDYLPPPPPRKGRDPTGIFSCRDNRGEGGEEAERLLRRRRAAAARTVRVCVWEDPTRAHLPAGGRGGRRSPHGPPSPPAAPITPARPPPAPA